MEERGFQQPFYSFNQIGVVWTACRGGYSDKHPCSLVGSVLSKMDVITDQAVLMKVKVLLLTLNHMLTSFSISGCLIRAGGRKYSREWNKHQDILRLFLVVRDQESNIKVGHF